MKITSLYALKPLVKTACQFAPYKLAATLFLMLFSSFTSGVGILMIIPLIASVGVDISSASSSNGFVSTINSLADYFGITLSLKSVLFLYFVLIVIMATTNFMNSVLSSSLRHSFMLNGVI